MKINNALLTVVMFLFAQSALASTPQAEVAKYIKWLKTLKAEPDYRVVDKVDQKRVQHWKVFRAKKKLYYPIIRRYLKRELSQRKASQMVLLDIGFNFSADQNIALYSKKGLKFVDGPLVDKAFRKINHQNSIIRSYVKTYYWFVFSFANSQPENILPLLDKILLPNKGNGFKLYLPKDKNNPHYKNTHFPIRVHAFGLYGAKSLSYLLGELKPGMNANRQEKIMSILRFICTDICAPIAYEQIKNGAGHLTLVHGIYILLDTGGPRGRDLVKKMDPDKYAGKSVIYLKTEMIYAKKVNYKALYRYFRKSHGKYTGLMGPTHIPRTMQEMEGNPAVFIRAHPHSLLDVEYDEAVIINHLLKIRRTLFLNTQDRKMVAHANRVINALYFRKAKRLRAKKSQKTEIYDE